MYKCFGAVLGGAVVTNRDVCGVVVTSGPYLSGQEGGAETPVPHERVACRRGPGAADGSPGSLQALPAEQLLPLQGQVSC